MKVCDITQFWSPVSGGVRRYVAEKVRVLRRLGGRHVLIVPGSEDSVTGDDAARIYTIASPSVSRVTQYRVLLRTGEITRILRAEKPDIVESGDPYQVGCATARAARELGIPAVAFYHSHFPESELRPLGRWLGATAAELFVREGGTYCARLYNRFAKTLVASPQIAATLAGWGVANIAEVDLGVDPARFTPRTRPAGEIRAELGIPADARVLLSVGRLAAEKNTRTLCEAFQRMPRGHHLIVTGEGLQRDAVLRARAATGAVTFLPFLDGHDALLRLFHAADVFVHPGVQETFGLVTLEAQSCGLSVVGIRGTAMDRIVMHTQEFWARENTAAALAGAMQAAFEHHPASLGAAAREKVVAQFSWDAVLARQFAIYRGVIASR